MTSIVDHPDHYQYASNVGTPLLKKHLGLTEDDLNKECIEFLESNPQYCDFHLGNAIKYLWRCGMKGNATEDLMKALWYLNRWQIIGESLPWWVKLWRSIRGRNGLKLPVSSLIDGIEEILSP